MEFENIDENVFKPFKIVITSEKEAQVLTALGNWSSNIAKLLTGELHLDSNAEKFVEKVFVCFYNGINNVKFSSADIQKLGSK